MTIRCDEPGCTETATRHWSTYARGVNVARRHTCWRHDTMTSEKTTPTLPTGLNTNPRRTRPRSAVGEAVALHHEAAEHCEALFLQHEGEVTDETEAAEARRDLTAHEALEALAKYERYLDAQEHAIAQEREALDRLARGIANRRTWADAQIVALAETVAPERSKVHAGLRVIQLRRSVAVETGDGFDPQALPLGWRREVPEKITPARVDIDRKAAAQDLLLGYREGEPPGPGWYDVEGHGRLWLERCTTDAGIEWASATPPGTPPIAAGGCLLRDLDLSIEPEPGLDTLRWKPSPPGVVLVHRTHVTVK